MTSSHLAATLLAIAKSLNKFRVSEILATCLCELAGVTASHIWLTSPLSTAGTRALHAESIFRLFAIGRSDGTLSTVLRQDSVALDGTGNSARKLHEFEGQIWQMRYDDRVAGLVQLKFAAPLEHVDEQLVQALVDMAAVTLVNLTVSEHAEPATSDGSDNEQLRTTQNLQTSERSARGQVNALTRTIDALAMESTPDRLTEHVLLTMTSELRAHSCSVWRRTVDGDWIDFQCGVEEGRFKSKTDHEVEDVNLRLRIGTQSMKIVFGSGKASLIPVVAAMEPSEWRDHMVRTGVVTVLLVPMSIAGRVDGFIGIRFQTLRTFDRGEIELAQALANQTILALQLTEMTVHSRHTAVVAERNRMAREIHDTLAQGFMGVIVQLEAADDAQLSGLPDDVATHIRRARDLARHSLNEARRSVKALRPSELGGKEIMQAVQDVVSQVAAENAIVAKFQTQGRPRGIPDGWHENLLRVIREGTINVVRHASATCVEVTVEFNDQELQITLQDDGCGFDVNATTEGFGLIGIKERTSIMGGSLVVRSELLVGTTLVITLPLSDSFQK